jgi:hypothetical protein
MYANSRVQQRKRREDRKGRSPRPPMATPRPERRNDNAPWHQHLQGLIAALQICVVALILLSCLSFGIAYVGIFLDDTCYHIPGAIRIAQHLNPYWVDSPVDSHWFPAAAETAVAVLVLLTRSLNVTNISGSLCFIAIVFLMYRFAGLWCRARLGRLATVACVSTIPLMIGQSLAFYVDIHLALLVCISMYFLCRSVLRRNARDAYYGLAAAWLAPSVKYSGVLMFPVLAVACGFCIWRSVPPRRPTAKVFVMLLLAAAFASGFYLRNWMYRGNPLYPFAVPGWFRPVVSLMHVPYEVDPEHGIASPTTAFPHPYLPASWLAHEYTPHMTDDAFGASGVVAAVCALLSLSLIRLQPSDQRRAWLFLLVVVTVLVASFPYGLRIPRYLLFVPILLSLGPAVLFGLLRRARAVFVADALCAVLLAFSGIYAAVNLVLPADKANGVRVAYEHLVPYNPAGRTYPYVRRGHLRIGYTSGFGNFIAALYDPHLTNVVIPLHYKNYAYNYWREMSSPQEFITYVASLRLDYIHVFDERYPGVDLLRANFPDKIMPEEMRAATKKP